MLFCVIFFQLINNLNFSLGFYYYKLKTYFSIVSIYDQRNICLQFKHIFLLIFFLFDLKKYFVVSNEKFL